MSEEQSNFAVFKATIPAYRSAIQIYGDGTGGSVKLEIPQSEREALHQLMDMTQCVLIITIARANPEKQNETDGTIPTRTKRQSRWAPAEE